MAVRKTTNVLKDDLTVDKNVKWLLRKFRDEVETYLKAHLTSEMQIQIDVKALADTILRQSIRRASQDDVYRGSSDMFRALLFKIAKNKRCSAVTFQQAQLRDPGTPVAGSEAIPHVSDKFIPPEEQVACRELMTAVISEVVKDPDVDRMLINILGCALELNASQIREILIARSPGAVILSVPTIHAQIRKTRAKILKMFSLDD